MSRPYLGRQNPVYLNPEPLDKLVALSGMTLHEFAVSCGITPVTLSRARNGKSLRISTLRRIAVGLSRLRTLKGLEGLDIVAVAPNNTTQSERAEVA
jgi:predicted transcriptional regulator